jgi:toxin-antitoxin system PIN domain toxin
MISVDVNVLVYGFDRSSAQHASALDVLESHRASPELMVLFPSVIAGFLRVMTDRRIFAQPIEPGVAVAFVDALLDGPSVRIAQPGPRHWELVRELMGTYAPRGPDVPDVFVAAAAIEQQLTWVSFDRGFARFRDLRWVNPADEA